jgi:hypothetical protein
MTLRRRFAQAFLVGAFVVVTVASPAFASYDAPGYEHAFAGVYVGPPDDYICAVGQINYYWNDSPGGTAYGNTVGKYGGLCSGGLYDYGYHALWSQTGKVWWNGTSWVVCGGTNSGYNDILPWVATSSQHYNCGNGFYQGTSTHWAYIQGTQYTSGIYPYFSGIGQY